MDLVRGFCQDSSEGPSLDLPLRTLWPLVIDLDDKSVRVKFYLKDGPNKSQDFTDEYRFALSAD
ncbi:MAG: hypothetical protein WC891_04140 [Actinomycetota bacterium]